VSRRAPPSGEAATWKGLVIIGGAVLLGVAVMSSFGNPSNGAIGSTQGTDAPRPKNSTTSTVPGTTSSSVPIRAPKDVKVLVANATSTSGSAKKVIEALKPACYAVQVQVEATAKVKGEKRPTTVYSTPGYEREAAKITIQLGLQTTANAALPPEPPVPTKGVPTYNVLVLVGQDLVDSPPQPLPPCETGGTGGSTSSTRKGSTPTTKSRGAATTAKANTTTTRRTTSTIHTTPT